jgi:peptide/nickel transport system permease protein
MTAYIIRRLILAIPILLGVTLVIFIILHSMPGDPAEVIADLDGKQEVLEKIRTDLGLDKPLLFPYLILIKNIFTRGDLGYSNRTRRPVTLELKERFLNTAILGANPIVFAFFIGVCMGILCAIKHNSKVDRLFPLSTS